MAEYTFEQLPEDLQAFLDWRATAAMTPEGAAAVIVVALLNYARGNEKSQEYLVEAVFSETLAGVPGQNALSKSRLQLVERQIKDKAYLVHSYFLGTTPENGYQLPQPPYRMEFSRNKYSGDEASGRVKVFIRCSGAATPRPITLMQEENGSWRAHEWSSLIVGVQPPKA